MTTYQDLHWDSLRFVRDLLYPRLVTLLSHALSPLGGAISPGDDAWHSLEAALNLIKAWSALTQVRSGGSLAGDQRHLLAPEALPVWLKQRLQAFGALRLEHRQPVLVHLETFYESLVLMSEIAAKSGPLKHVTLANNPGETAGVWVRAVFDPPEGSVYAGLKGLLARLDSANEAQRLTAIQVHVLRDLCAVNGATLRVQTNTTTGEQALAAYFGSVAAAPAAPVQEPTAVEERSETLIVPPPGFADRLAALGELAATLEPVENEPETLIVPPPGMAEQVAKLASLTAALDKLEGDIKAIVETPQPAEGPSTAPEPVENQPETLAAGSAPDVPAPDSPAEAVTRDPFTRMENASATVIFSTAGPGEAASPAPPVSGEEDKSDGGAAEKG